VGEFAGAALVVESCFATTVIAAITTTATTVIVTTGRRRSVLAVRDLDLFLFFMSAP
jgi:hypothetical protein